MLANRDHLVGRFIPQSRGLHDTRAASRELAHDNLGLRLDKLNAEIDFGSEHEQKDYMLNVLENFRMSAELRKSYGLAFKRWKKINSGRGGCRCFEVEATSRVLMGTGNDSIFEFGVNLNRPWGVPYISGTTLKGLASAYLAANYGEDWHRDNKSSSKSEYQVEMFGGTLKNGKDKDDYTGLLNFMDAWLVPEGDSYTWFVPDIINCHHHKYYGGRGRDKKDQGKTIAPPDGTDNPIPVKIAALKPGLRFLVVIRGPEDMLDFIKKILLAALEQEGVGGKTAVGYGRFGESMPCEEKYKDVINALAGADAAALKDLYEKNKLEKELWKYFYDAVHRIEPTPELEGVYSKVAPLRSLVLRIETGQATSRKKMIPKGIKKKIEGFMTRHPEIKLGQTDDGERILRHAEDELGLTQDDLKGNGVLKLLLP